MKERKGTERKGERKVFFVVVVGFFNINIKH